MITRYILKCFLKTFSLTLGALVLIQMSVEFLQKISILYKYHPGFYLLFSYFILRVPNIVFDLMPLAILLSTLLTFGTLAKSNEITAFKSSGVSIFHLAAPVLLFGLLSSALSCYLVGGIVPSLTKKSARIRKLQIEKKKHFGRFVQNRAWLRLDKRRLMFVQTISSDKKHLKGVHLYKLGADFSMETETEAAELVYEEKSWVLLKGSKRRFLPGGSLQFSTFERENLPITQSPEDFQEVSIRMKEMSYRGYRDYIRQLQRMGLEASRWQVDLRSKQALPFASFLMVLLGIPFALKDSRSAGLARGIAISLSIALSYWLVFSVTLSLGRLGVLPPWLAAWSANILFLLLGAALFLKIRQ